MARLVTAGSTVLVAERMTGGSLKPVALTGVTLTGGAERVAGFSSGMAVRAAEVTGARA